MSLSVRWVFPVALACVAAASVPPAGAAIDVVCSPFVPHVRNVGNTSTDASCTDDTIQAAIDNTVCPNTTIVITPERSYTGQHLIVQDKSLSLVGSAGSCGAGGTRPDAVEATPTAPLITLDGSGNGGTSVLAIRGTSTVTLQFLELTHGDGGAGAHGGGVDFQAAGSLILDTTTIDLNRSDFGGGIEFAGVGGHSRLTLGQYSIIEENTAAANGGGINLEGDAEMLVTAPFTYIGLNHAPNGMGGGIAVIGPAQADIGSPGFLALPVIDGNDAQLGGGIAVNAVHDDQFAYANLFTTDPNHPVTVSGNFASQAGGAIYVKPHSSNFSSLAFSYACVVNAHIDGNSAPEGAAVYLDNERVSFGSIGSSVLQFNAGLCGESTPGSVACAKGLTCGTLDGNRAVDGTNHPTGGSVIFTNGDAQTFAYRFLMRNNTAAHGLRLLDDTHDFNECVITDNAFANETIYLQAAGIRAGQPSASFANCTIAHNAHNSGSIIRAEFALTLTRSILDQPAMSSLDTANNPTLAVSYVLAADPTGLPSQPDIVRGEPLYVDAAHGNYRQFAFSLGGQAQPSPGMDFAPLVSGQTTDLDGKPRDVDVPGVPNGDGVRDLGAYEAQPIADRIFADTFGDPLALVL